MLSRKTVFDIFATDDNRAYILIAGHDLPNNSPVSSPYQYYDYASNSWIPINVPTYTSGNALSQGVVMFPSKKCYLLSEEYLGIFTAMFDLNTLSLEPNRIFEFSVRPIATKLASLIKLRNGKIFILGYDPNNKLNECYIYDSKVDYP